MAVSNAISPLSCSTSMPVICFRVGVGAQAVLVASLVSEGRQLEPWQLQLAGAGLESDLLGELWQRQVDATLTLRRLVREKCHRHRAGVDVAGDARWRFWLQVRLVARPRLGIAAAVRVPAFESGVEAGVVIAQLIVVADALPQGYERKVLEDLCDFDFFDITHVAPLQSKS